MEQFHGKRRVAEIVDVTVCNNKLYLHSYIHSFIHVNEHVFTKCLYGNVGEQTETEVTN